MSGMARTWWIAGLVALLSAGMVSAKQLLMNQSFEDPETEEDNPYGDLAEGWGRWGHWMNRESEWKPTKSGACLMGYHHWEIEEKDTSGIYQDVEDVDGGSTCTFSIFASKDAKTNAESIELRIEKLGGFETLASTVYRLSELKGSNWHKLSVTATTRDPGVRLVVVVTPCAEEGRDGAIKFDDADLKVE